MFLARLLSKYEYFQRTNDNLDQYSKFDKSSHRNSWRNGQAQKNEYRSNDLNISRSVNKFLTVIPPLKLVWFMLLASKLINAFKSNEACLKLYF